MASIPGTNNNNNNSSNNVNNNRSDGDESLELQVESQGEVEEEYDSHNNNQYEGDGSLSSRVDQYQDQLVMGDCLGEPETLYEAFRKWDEDGSGSISKQEFVALLTELGFAAADIVELYHAADANKDDCIDYEEFVSWLCGPANLLPEKMVHQRTDTEFSFSLLSGTADPAQSPDRDLMLELQESDCALNGELVGGCVLNGFEVELIPPRRRVNGMVHVRASGLYGAVWEGWLAAEHLQGFPSKMVHRRIGRPRCTELRKIPDRDRRHCIRGSAVQSGEVVEVLPPFQLVNDFLQVKHKKWNGWLWVKYLEEYVEK